MLHEIRCPAGFAANRHESCGRGDLTLRSCSGECAVTVQRMVDSETDLRELRDPGLK